jgi:hypothetical protein
MGKVALIIIPFINTYNSAQHFASEILNTVNIKNQPIKSTDKNDNL